MDEYGRVVQSAECKVLNENAQMSRTRSGTPRSKRIRRTPAYCAEYRSVRGSLVRG